MLRPISDSNESLPESGVLEDPRPDRRGRATEVKGYDGASFYTGVLYKKRRKKGQGSAKRFFSLDFTSCTLSYYRDRHSSGLRGAVPLSLAAIGANEKTREFSIDSGAEVWHLKALSSKDFDGWRDALERASAASPAISPTPMRRWQGDLPSSAYDPSANEDWARVEQLVSKVAGTRDAVRGLAKDTDPKYIPTANGAPLAPSWSRSSSNAPSPSSYEQTKDYFGETDEKATEKRPFWKRRPSERQASTERKPSAHYKRSVSHQLTVPTSVSVMPPPPSPASPQFGPIRIPPRSQMPTLRSLRDDDVHERCMALLRDLDSVVADFSALLAENRARRPQVARASTRLSLDSVADQEFFDAEDGTSPTAKLLDIGKPAESDFEDAHEEPLFDQDSDAESELSSEAGDVKPQSSLESAASPAQQSDLVIRPQSLAPLPLEPVRRRGTVAPPKHAPPSIIGFLRKNAGKDLSTVSMPVTANEPTSALQRLAESMEYSHLLDSAALSSLSPLERLMYIATFAITYFANNRVKERAIRKPFNPMLGETFELVREDLGFRFLAEKISHHPVKMACQAESLANGGWTFLQSPQPLQKFWGKSVELNTEGRARVLIHAAGEQYSWSQATCFLRNVIAGEKYVEPVQSITVLCESTGMKAVATFKAGGMFSGRSEEVTIELFDPRETERALPLAVAGKWTESLKRTDTGEMIWRVGGLVPDAPKVYGFTAFAATLNQTTEIETGRLPPTDSRLRPDQLALENGDVDSAEALKAKLEERQRARRKVLEVHGQPWAPRFFEKVDRMTSGDGEEVWRLKNMNSYWDRREKGDWHGIGDVFEV